MFFLSNYQPGVCNIGKNEINKRYLFGLVGFIFAIALAALLLYYQIFIPLSLAILFFPFMAGYEGFFQGKMKFCAGFASRGIYNFYGTVEEKGKVENESDHHADMQQAIKIHMYSIFLSILTTAIIFGVAYVPVFLKEQISESFIRIFFYITSSFLFI